MKVKLYIVTQNQNQQMMCAGTDSFLPAGRLVSIHLQVQLTTLCLTQLQEQTKYSSMITGLI